MSYHKLYGTLSGPSTNPLNGSYRARDTVGVEGLLTDGNFVFVFRPGSTFEVDGDGVNLLSGGVSCARLSGNKKRSLIRRRLRVRGRELGTVGTSFYTQPVGDDQTFVLVTEGVVAAMWLVTGTDANGSPVYKTISAGEYVVLPPTVPSMPGGWPLPVTFP